MLVLPGLKVVLDEDRFLGMKEVGLGEGGSLKRSLDSCTFHF
jgi:hypothetical protein